jgi:pimeloyl-ACP methyl ester carboxylesterase
MNELSYRRRRGSIRVFIYSFVAIWCFLGTARLAQGQPPPREGRDTAVPASPAASSPVIVIGFLGGMIRHDDPVHSVVQVAASLRKAYPSGVDVETFENSRGENARKRILSLLDANRDGRLSPSEKQNARVILYGHSWGASEAIAVARELDDDDIPVLLTIQVDSVSKPLQNDAVIPENVARAANFYQPDGFIHGQSAIRAADPAHTKIIGNFRFDYKARPFTCYEYPWYSRILVKTHTQIECDPIVWNQVEALIRSDLPPTTANSSGP